MSLTQELSINIIVYYDSIRNRNDVIIILSHFTLHDTPLPPRLIDLYPLCSHLNHSGKLLYLVEEGVSLLDNLLILPVLLVWSAGLDDVAHFVYLGIDAACGDESGKLSVQHMYRDAK